MPEPRGAISLLRLRDLPKGELQLLFQKDRVPSHKYSISQARETERRTRTTQQTSQIKKSTFSMSCKCLVVCPHDLVDRTASIYYRHDVAGSFEIISPHPDTFNASSDIGEVWSEDVERRVRCCRYSIHYSSTIVASKCASDIAYIGRRSEVPFLASEVAV